MDEDIDKRNRTIIENFELEDIDNLDLSSVEEMLASGLSTTRKVSQGISAIEEADGERRRKQARKSKSAKARNKSKKEARAKQCTQLQEHSYVTL